MSRTVSALQSEWTHAGRPKQTRSIGRWIGALALGTIALLWTARLEAEGPRIPEFMSPGTQRGAYASGGGFKYAGPPVSVEQEPVAPTTGLSLRIYPSPVGLTGRVSFVLTVASNVEITILDLAGRIIQRVERGRQFEAGPSHVEFSARSLPAGVYFCRFTLQSSHGRAQEIQKFAVVR